jgi:hypothetical protein
MYPMAIAAMIRESIRGTSPKPRSRYGRMTRMTARMSQEALAIRVFV